MLWGTSKDSLLLYRGSTRSKADDFEHVSEADEEEDIRPLPATSVTAVDVYQAVVALRPRLELCVTVHDVIPGVGDVLKLDPNTNGFNLDILSVNAACDLVEPVVSDMLNTTAKQAWSSRVIALSTFVK